MRKAALLLPLLFLLVSCGLPSATTGQYPGSVAYIAGGNLWTQALPDGAPSQLTTAGGFSSPSWSASGRWLLVHRGDERWVVSTENGDQPNTVQSLPPTNRLQTTWSPAADLLAHGNDRTILVTGADGSGVTPVVQAPENTELGRFSWSPDGRWIAYEVRTLAPSHPPGYSSLWRAPAAGGKPELLYQAEEGNCQALAGWTPDSKAVLFWPMPACSGSILADGAPLMFLSSGESTVRKVAPVTLAHPDFWQISSQNQLAVADGPNRATWTMKSIAVGTLPADSAGGRAAESITPNGLAAISPAWSPDGKRLTYVATTATSGGVMGGDEARQVLMGRRLWLIAPDGSGNRQLTHDSNYRDEAPVWTRDGHQILFARLNGANEASLWLVDPTAKEPKPRKIADIDPVETRPDGWFGFYGWLDWSTRFAYYAPH